MAQSPVKQGYSYRDTSTEIDVDLSTPEDTYETRGLTPARITDTRDPSKTNPLADAFLEIADQEIKSLHKQGREQQALDGAIRASEGEAIESIRKRSSAMDWVYGTNAKASAAASVHASVKITEWSAASLADMNSHQQVDPKTYQELKMAELSDAASQIEDPAVRKAFIYQSKQRLSKLVAIQMDSHHTYTQQKAANDFQVDLKGRMAHIQQMEKTGGLAYEIAKEELHTLFTTIPTGMTAKSHQSNIAVTIISSALDGNLSLYQHADAQGYLDNMPEQLRTDVEEKYKKIAPTNNMAFVAADEAYKEAIDNPAISGEELDQIQMDFVADWFGVQTYPDETLANHRRRHTKIRQAARNTAAELAADTLAYQANKTEYISVAGTARGQAAALNYFHLLHKQDLTASEQQAFVNLSPEEKQNSMFQTLRQQYASKDPAERAKAMNFVNKIARKTSHFGVPIKAISDSFQWSTNTLVLPDGRINPNAESSLKMMSTYLQQGNLRHLSYMVNEDTLQRAIEYDRLTNAGGMDSADALAQMTQLQGIEPRKITSDESRKGREAGLEAFNKTIKGTHVSDGWLGSRWGSPDAEDITKVNSHIDAMATMLLRHSNQYSVESAYAAAGAMVATQYEAIGTFPINKGNRHPLEVLMGYQTQDRYLEEDVSYSFANYMEKEDRPPLPYTSDGIIDWDEVYMQVNMGSNLISITPKDSDEPQFSTTTMHFKAIVAMTEGRELALRAAKEAR